MIWYDLHQGYYLSTSRELTRLESITKAPVIHHFSETVQGVMTIRCFRKEESFLQENLNRVNSSLRMDFHNNGANEWLGFRLELIGSFVLCFTAVLMVTLPSNFVKPGGLLTDCLSLSGVLYGSTGIFSNFSNSKTLLMVQSMLVCHYHMVYLSTRCCSGPSGSVASLKIKWSQLRG
jgi:ABC-type multidrug transport system fused ATPase/permease subunit